MEPTEQQPDVADLLPHRGDLLLIDDIFEWSKQSIRCGARFDVGWPYAAPDGVPVPWALELGAQAAAVHAILNLAGRNEREPAPRGYLVGLREVELNVPLLPLDRELDVVARLTGRVRALSVYETEVVQPLESGEQSEQSRTLATATLSAYLIETE